MGSSIEMEKDKSALLAEEIVGEREAIKGSFKDLTFFCPLSSKKAAQRKGVKPRGSAHMLKLEEF